MEFQTNKGTLMLSSVSANIITQLGYLRNYAMEGHFFFTSEIQLGIPCCLFSARANVKPLHFHPTQLTSNAFAQGCRVQGTCPSLTYKSLGVQVFIVSSNQNVKTVLSSQAESKFKLMGMCVCVWGGVLNAKQPAISHLSSLSLSLSEFSGHTK